MPTIVILLLAITLMISQGIPISGPEIFKQNKCSVCHSIDGKGNTKGQLDGVGNKYDQDELRQWLRDPISMAEKTKADRKPPMKPFELPEDQETSLVNYLSSLRK